MRLAGKRIVVTGARGIAAAGARSIAREGGRIFIISLHRQECEALSADIDDAGFAVADLTDEGAAEDAFSAAVSELGALDGVLAVAGGSGRGFGDGPIDEMTLKALEETIRINADPTFLAAREAVRSMRPEGGSVVLVSAVLAASPAPRYFATHGYAAAKGAINSLTTSLAAYYASAKIRVNAIAPGLVRTPMAERAAGNQEIVDYAARKQPLVGGFLEPDDIASAAVFLLSDESAAITGQVLTVDAGWSVTEA